MSLRHLYQFPSHSEVRGPLSVLLIFVFTYKYHYHLPDKFSFSLSHEAILQEIPLQKSNIPSTKLFKLNKGNVSLYKGITINKWRKNSIIRMPAFCNFWWIKVSRQWSLIVVIHYKKKDKYYDSLIRGGAYNFIRQLGKKIKINKNFSLNLINYWSGFSYKYSGKPEDIKEHLRVVNSDWEYSPPRATWVLKCISEKRWKRTYRLKET